MSTKEEEIHSFSFSIINHLERSGNTIIHPPARELKWEINGVKHSKWQHVLNGKWVDDDD